MLKCLRAVGVLVALLVVPTAVYAQASIVGTVKDASGAVLPGVTVEASSPALIEKTRTVVTSGTGQYSIENLRPGTYAVTFTLTGFATAKREGIELTGSFTATVNTDMKVGAVSETVTVSGEAPVVDVTSAKAQQVITGSTVNEIPTSRQYGGLIALVPSINVQGNDVGGAQGGVFNVFQVHGGRRNEGQVQVDGMSAGYQGMGVSSYVTEVGNAQEVVFSLSGGLGEANTGGPQMNIIGKQGGNRFAGNFFINGTGSALQGTNLTPELQAKGLTTAQSLAKAWDINPAYGGPIIKDKLWFFGTFRYQSNDQNVASMWVNLNAGDPTKWTYLPADGKNGRPLEVPIDDGRWKNGSLRLTWQATERNKINFFTDYQRICQHCIQGGSSSGQTFSGTIASPEALQRVENRPNSMTQVSWTSPVTSKLLLEGNVQLGPYFWWGGTQKNAYDPTTIPVNETAGLIPGLNYRSSDWSDHTGFTNIIQGAASYVTGSHSAKFGIRYMSNDSTFPKNYYNNAQLHYQFTNGSPINFTMYADQASQQQQHQGMTALYAQDRWTLHRLTLQAGLRFERLVDHFAQQQMGPNIFLPTAVVFPAQDGPQDHKDLQPRFGATYDVFGNGKTALKFFMGEYVTTVNTVDEWVNFSPAGLGHFVSNVQRTWVDANHDFVPNCNLLDQSAQNDPTAPGYNPAKDSCGVGNPFFGKYISPLTVDPAATTGWNTREHSWDLSGGISQQLAPRVSVDLTYNRRSWGNIATTINRALKPTDFNPFTYNVPKDPKLPGGGGYTLTFEEIAPAKYNQFDNLYTLADNEGGVINRYNGVDGSVNARLQQGITVQAGFSTGNVIEDECGLAAAHPDVYISSIINGGSLGFGSQFIGGLAQLPQSFCHRESGWQTNYKGLASYNVPKIDVVFSGTFHSLPYPGSNFPAVTSQSLTGTAFLLSGETSIGFARGFSGAAPVQFFNIVKPGTVYGDRLNGLDLRIGKILKYGRTKTQVALDIFNVTNSNAIDVYQQTYGPTILTPQSTYLNPLSITQARFFKIGVQIDF
jgi:Carboxypeptidase regulatory-like domain